MNNHIRIPCQPSTLSTTLLVLLGIWISFSLWTEEDEKPLSFFPYHPLNSNFASADGLHKISAQFNCRESNSSSYYATYFPGPVQWFSLNIVSTVVKELFKRNLEEHSAVDRRSSNKDLGLEIYDYTTKNKDKPVHVYEFIADTGDSYDVTYAIASFLTSPKNRLQHLNTTHVPEYALQNPPLKPDALIFGGDLVYPQPSLLGMMNRFIHPFAHANGNNKEKIDVWAIPGNHDYLDGRKAFDEIFLLKGEDVISDPHCRIGMQTSWHIPQKHPWFVARISTKWYMIGIDDQVGNDIDIQQYNHIVNVTTHLPSGSQIVLFMHAPVWYPTTTKVSVFGLRTKLMRYLWSTGLVRVVIAGDKHHFSYYRTHRTEYDPHLFVAGGGGGFLHPTHTLPKNIDKSRLYSLVPTDPDWILEEVYPSKEQSNEFTSFQCIRLLLSTELVLVYLGLHTATAFFPKTITMAVLKLLLLAIIGFPLWNPETSVEKLIWLGLPILLCAADWSLCKVTNQQHVEEYSLDIRKLVTWISLSIALFLLAATIGAKYTENTSDTLFAALGRKEFKNLIRIVIDKETEALTIVPLGFDYIPHNLTSPLVSKLIGGPYTIPVDPSSFFRRLNFSETMKMMQNFPYRTG